MDPRGVYNLAEIWPGFHSSNNFSSSLNNESNAANATSYGVGLDPMLTDHGTNDSPQPNHNSRKQIGENERARAGASTSNSNNGDGNNSNYNNAMNDGDDNKRLKAANSDGNLENKREGESTCNKMAQPEKPAEPSRQDYIHVRARRGEATDSHSLAERARREKISERMKILQDIVPGCNKVIGKALVLDEIINYIQSLQRQVDFLSMKLEAVNTQMGTDGFTPQPKDFVAHQTTDASNMGFGGSQSTRGEYDRGLSPEWLHMQIGGAFKRPT